jgi:hypothetical protein
MKRLLALAVVLAAAHVAIFSEAPLLVRALAALTIAGFIPGALLTALLSAAGLHSPIERLLLSIGAAFTVITLGMLCLSYLPGGVEHWQALLLFDALTILLFVILWRRGKLTPKQDRQEVVAYPTGDRRWLLAGCLVLLVAGGFFRFVDLGYAEFHGDEARAVLRAAAVVQGHEDALLIHRKGPVEIMVPAAIFVLAGQIDEAAARLPFALAGLAGVFAVFHLGWRVFGGAAGWIAALLLALNGYFIAFSRFVQYQSVVILTTTLALLLLIALLHRPLAATRRLTLAALLFATALLAHYDALAAAPPLMLLVAGVLLRAEDRRSMARSLGVAGLAGFLCLALYYIPFLLHPNFAATLSYLMSERIVGDARPPFDNLSELFVRGALYNSAYQMALLLGLLLIALILVFWRGYGRTTRAVLVGMTLAVTALIFWQENWLGSGGIDLTFAPVAFLLLLACLAPAMLLEPRSVWVWFAAPFVFLLFFTAFPRTHVYVFFAPWALLAGDVVALGWLALTRGWPSPAKAVLAGAATIAAVVVLGGYPYWLYVDNTTERLRLWPAQSPRLYWSPSGVEAVDGRFGFPFTNGWKAIGALYEQGVISGDYETNQRYAWIPSWYVRGGQRCHSSAEWYFAVDNLEPWMEGKEDVADRLTAEGFALWGVVEVNDVERMHIYRTSATAAPVAPVQRLRLEELAPFFDNQADADLPLPWPIVSTTPQHPFHINFGGDIRLEGYTVGASSAAPGGALPVTLYWQAQHPLERSYKVTVQSYYGDGVKVAQHDGLPACDREPTSGWSPGEVIEDSRSLPIRLDAPPGVYPLYVGLYDEATGEPLPVLDEAANPAGTQVQIGEIEIE